jgi:hypothetical protein
MRKWIFLVIIVILNLNLYGQIKKINITLSNNKKINLKINKTDLKNNTFVFVKFDSSLSFVPVGILIDQSNGWLKKVQKFQVSKPGRGVEYITQKNGLLFDFRNLAFIDSIQIIFIPQNSRGKISTVLELEGFKNLPVFPLSENTGEPLLIVNINE